MRLITTLALIALAATSFAQVGIGTTTPQAQLHIEASDAANPTASDGIIIPRVDVLPTGAANGMMVYLNAGAGNQEGLYINTSAGFVKAADGNDTIFYNEGTTTAATTTTADVEREGNVSIGGSLNTGKLNIQIEDTDPVGTRIGIRIDNDNNSTSGTETYGLFSENSSETTGEKVGIRTDVTTTGSGTHIGIANNVSPTGTANSLTYGIRNDVAAGTPAVSSTIYGIWSDVGDDNDRGVKYGIWSRAQNNGQELAQAAHFEGDVFVGTQSVIDAMGNVTTPSDGYVLPAGDGTAGQVMTTDGAGQVTWADTHMDREIVRYNFWNAGGYGVNPSGVNFNYQNGLQNFILPTDISVSGNVQVRMTIFVENNSNGLTAFQLRSFNNLAANAIVLSEGQLPFTAFDGGGYYRSAWIDVSMGTDPLKLVLYARNEGSNSATLQNAYIDVRSQ